MAALSRSWAADLLHAWFHELEPRDWWGGSEKADAFCRRRYARWLEALHRRPAAEFLDNPRMALAAVLLFDQVPRNLYSGTAQAFAYDALARSITYGALARGWDRSLQPVERQFLGMPLMHSEEIVDQRNSLEFFAALGRKYGFPFARDHYRMIARFGRYPHRNKLLGRTSTAAEERAIAAGFAW